MTTESKTAETRRTIVEAVAKALRDEADMMERGETHMLQGPDALREFADDCLDALSVKEDIENRAWASSESKND
jgi:hypothetical protein